MIRGFYEAMTQKLHISPELSLPIEAVSGKAAHAGIDRGAALGASEELFL
jgi:hypothetical protein